MKKPENQIVVACIALLIFIAGIAGVVLIENSPGAQGVTTPIVCTLLGAIGFVTASFSTVKLLSHNSKKTTSEAFINQLKAEAISEMIGSMPPIGFSSMRERNNWIGNYIQVLEAEHER